LTVKYLNDNNKDIITVEGRQMLYYLNHLKYVNLNLENRRILFNFGSGVDDNIDDTLKSFNHKDYTNLKTISQYGKLKVYIHVTASLELNDQEDVKWESQNSERLSYKKWHKIPIGENTQFSINNQDNLIITNGGEKIQEKCENACLPMVNGMLEVLGKNPIKKEKKRMKNMFRHFKKYL
jgi:hypothetical protein